MRHVFQRTVVGMALLVAPAAAFAQSTTLYHFHSEVSSQDPSAGQLQTAPPNNGAVTFQGSNLKNLSANQFIQIKRFETQGNIQSGTIPGKSVGTFTVWMRKTAAFGTFHVAAKLWLNTSNFGTFV